MKSMTSRVHKISLIRSFFPCQKLSYASKVAADKGQNSLIAKNNIVRKTDMCQHPAAALPQLPKKFSSISPKADMQKNISAVPAKKRIPRKKPTSKMGDISKKKWHVVAYSSAEEYNLRAVAKEIEKKGVYKILPFPEDHDEVLHVSANYQIDKEPRHIYFFSEGSVVFWNAPDLEQQSVLEFLKPFEMNSYDENVLKEEKEDIEYSYGESETKLSNGLIVLKEGLDVESLETFAFSNGMVLSVKLGMWEATLEGFVDSIEWVTESMKSGQQIQMSRRQVFQRRGELFALRHAINLSSDLLDTPDFYWSRDELETLYKRTCNYLNVAKRTKVMNERLNYCSELIDLLGNHMNDKHHVRLELMIIALIMIEVMFECVHFISRVFQE